MRGDPNNGDPITVDCRGGKLFKWFKGYGTPYSKNETCPNCHGSDKEDCTNCSGYGYLKSTKTEYYDDSFCSGKGKVSNFKVMFD